MKNLLISVYGLGADPDTLPNLQLLSYVHRSAPKLDLDIPKSNEKMKKFQFFQSC